MVWSKFADDRLTELYNSNRKSMAAAARHLRALIRRCIASIEDRALVRVELRALRVKTLASLKQKAEKHEWSAEHALWFCRDLIGCRVVCNNIEDAYRFVELLKDALPIFPQTAEIQDQIEDPNPTGYRALHLNFSLDVGGPPLFGVRMPCEVQVRTRLQDAWAELSHDDIYKARTLPEDLRERFSDLARYLAAADEVASGIRRKVTSVVAPPDKRPVLSKVSSEGLVYIFNDVFGRSPPDYLVGQATGRAVELNLTSLLPVARSLKSKAFRQRASEAYLVVMPVPISTEELFLAAVAAGANGEDWAIAELSRVAAEEWEAIDQTARREALSALPETIEAFCEAVEAYGSEDEIISWASAWRTTTECFCGRAVVDAHGFAEAAMEYYDIDDDDVRERIETATLSSGVDTGGFDDSSLCSYHDDQMRKDD